MLLVGTRHLHGHDLQRVARNKLATYSLRFAAQSSGGGLAEIIVVLRQAEHTGPTPLAL